MATGAACENCLIKLEVEKEVSRLMKRGLPARRSKFVLANYMISKHPITRMATMRLVIILPAVKNYLDKCQKILEKDLRKARWEERKKELGVK